MRDSECELVDDANKPQDFDWLPGAAQTRDNCLKISKEAVSGAYCYSSAVDIEESLKKFLAAYTPQPNLDQINIETDPISCTKK